MRTCLALLLFPVSMLAQAAEWRDSPQLAELFKREGVSGTFVVHDLAADTYTVHDRNRALTRYVPASTFKIPNSLIGLSLGVVSSVDEVLPYGGKPARRPEWAQDMPLREAIKVSNVPVYQGLARRIGLERMRRALQQLDYGNTDPGSTVDTFWLDGPLKISAFEQTRLPREARPGRAAAAENRHGGRARATRGRRDRLVGRLGAEGRQAVHLRPEYRHSR